MSCHLTTPHTILAMVVPTEDMLMRFVVKSVSSVDLHCHRRMGSYFPLQSAAIALICVYLAAALPSDYRDCNSCVEYVFALSDGVLLTLARAGYGWCTIRRLCGGFANKECLFADDERNYERAPVHELDSMAEYDSEVPAFLCCWCHVVIIMRTARSFVQAICIIALVQFCIC